MPCGQDIILRVVETIPLRRHHMTKYRCEVMSPESPYLEQVDFLSSAEDMRFGHTYEVRLNDNPSNPMILDAIREIETTEERE